MKISKEIKKLILYVVGTIGFLLLLLWVYWFAQSIESRPLASRRYSFSLKTYFSDLSHSFGNIQSKIDRIRNSAEENEKLRLENFNLKLTLETFQYSCNAKSGKQLTKEFELKLSRETGAKVGRSLSSINYQAPSQLFPSQLYTLALAYVVAREDEKAVVLLTLLTGQAENATYKTAKDYLMTGVAWFRIENFTLADSYFDDVLKIPESEVSIKYQAQARLWKAIVADRLEKKHKSQFWLKELVDHHPGSNESKWINVAEDKHGTAK